MGALTHHATATKPFVFAFLRLPHPNFITHVFQRRGAVEVLNGKYAPEDRFQTTVFSVHGRALLLQKARVGLLLHLYEIGKIDNRGNTCEILPLPTAISISLRFISYSHSLPSQVKMNKSVEPLNLKPSACEISLHLDLRTHFFQL